MLESDDRFLYEYANHLFTQIEETPKLAAYRKTHSQDDIVAFCVYFAKRMRRSLSLARAQQSGTTMNGRYIYEFYPGNSYTQTQQLLEAAGEAWSQHIQTCVSCPHQCLTEGFELTDMFDNLKQTHWPTR